ncbi:peptidoglycan hydrolase-like protein with peptidoglycan-binding domain [Saccharomonospora amisosensis]|uniref:Peptidoglycan hydrolase-like protein with peptidoglycan-binding domain n=1 Tax=Saccharomonospora amisosensis TaxID=1128677 RepID=A0A7X5ZRX0_9PSEU|nr:peptidoglycan-binding domain-containing protein [Saccharomonospora amisosensis]NIJ13329.1 peptidoglycan hydrolase-like protein with peptidoglycan-binding domain [Saccharomonospora amisosensis]
MTKSIMRRLTAAAVLTAVSGGLLPGTATASPARSEADGTSSSTVNMEALIKAAMWDPYKSGQGVTDGSGPSVRRVEAALAVKGLLARKYVDGHFGTSTVQAYAAYQRSLGHSGLAASGLPGKGSLAKLGNGRYSLNRIIDVGGRTTMEGKPINQRTARMIRAAQRRAGVDFTVTQGSYGGVDASGGTHDGGGAVDLSVRGLPNITAAVRALRQVGFAAWHRKPSQGPWAAHIHAVAISDTDMSPQAQRQVGAYFNGRNGLANNGKDDGPKVKKVTWEEYRRR